MTPKAPDPEAKPSNAVSPRPKPVWNNSTQGHLLCIDWGRWLNSGKHLDPYLVWADMSRFAGFDGGTEPKLGGGNWPILVECAKGCSPELPSPSATKECKVSDVFASTEIPALYKEQVSGGGVRMISRFFTARIAPNSVEQLLTSSDVRRFQLGLPRLYSTDETPPPVDDLQLGKDARTVVGIIDDGCAFAHPAFCDAQGNTRVHFLWDQDAKRTPVPVPQDPTSWRDPFGWSFPLEAGYGAELRFRELCRASKEGIALGSTEAAYACVNYAPVRLDPETHGTMLCEPGEIPRPVQSMRRSSHGASVMHLVAGVEERVEPEKNDDPLIYVRPLQSQRALFGPAATPVVTRTGSLPNDYATQWPIVFVQLPTRTILDTSGGSLGVHVLDGLRYIANRASLIPYDDNQRTPSRDSGSQNPAAPDTVDKAHTDHRLVVTISYGAVAGPHDGTSIVEQAIVDFVQERNYTWVCLAAGNSHKSRTHARMSLTAGDDKSFLWRVGADNPLQSFLEVWLPDVDSKGEALHENDRAQLVITVEPPGGLPPQRVCMGELWTCETTGPDGKPRALAGAVFSRTVAQGLRGTMVLLAVAATRPAFGKEAEPVGCHGDWIVSVFNGMLAGTPREVVVHAWAERNDLLYGNQRSQQGTVVSTDPVPEPTEYTPEARLFSATRGRWWGNQHLPDDFQPRYSLGSLSGADRQAQQEFFQVSSQKGKVVVAGAHRMADGEVSEYSSGGPNRHAEPRNGSTGTGDTKAMGEAYGAASWPLDKPVVGAPADVGQALRGLRTSGMRAGSMARLSGTSAAAPCVARAIANARYAVTWERANRTEDAIDGEGETKRPAVLERLGIVKNTPPVGNEARPTPTPGKDDKYRRGKWRIAP